MSVAILKYLNHVLQLLPSYDIIRVYRFPTLIKILKLLLRIPTNAAPCEKCFSTSKRLKT